MTVLGTSSVKTFNESDRLREGGRGEATQREGGRGEATQRPSTVSGSRPTPHRTVVRDSGGPQRLGGSYNNTNSSDVTNNNNDDHHDDVILGQTRPCTSHTSHYSHSSHHIPSRDHDGYYDTNYSVSHTSEGVGTNHAHRDLTESAPEGLLSQILRTRKPRRHSDTEADHPGNSNSNNYNSSRSGGANTESGVHNTQGVQQHRYRRTRIYRSGRRLSAGPGVVSFCLPEDVRQEGSEGEVDQKLSQEEEGFDNLAVPRYGTNGGFSAAAYRRMSEPQLPPISDSGSAGCVGSSYIGSSKAGSTSVPEGSMSTGRREQQQQRMLKKEKRKSSNHSLHSSGGWWLC